MIDAGRAIVPAEVYEELDFSGSAFERGAARAPRVSTSAEPKEKAAPRQSVQRDTGLTDFLPEGRDTSAERSGQILINIGAERIGELVYNLSRDGQLQVHPWAIQV
jgi:hypothetical protein